MDQQSKSDRRLVTAEMLNGLPDPVQRYLTTTGVVGRPWIETVRLKQEGKFRMAADRSWMPFTAEQYYTTDPPSFVWDARFKIAGLPLMRGRDRYEGGHGHIFGKLAGLVTIFDLTGDKLDQATMIRYLNEIMWFPTAYLADYISWQAIDDRSARVTFRDAGREVSAEIFFDDAGRLVNFKAMRYREKDGNFTYDPWSTPILGYFERAGLQLPLGGQAVWNLESGDLVYAELEITELEYNSAA